MGLLTAAGLLLRALGFLRAIPFFGVISTVFGAAASVLTIVASTYAALPASVRRLIIYAVVLGAAFLGGVYYGHKINEDAAAQVQARWDAAAIATTAEINKLKIDGAKTNAQAEQAIPALTPADRAADSAIQPRGVPCRVYDPFDRSCAGRSR